MKRKKRTALWIVLVLVLAIGGVCVWQRNNIHALLLSRTMTQDELSDQMSRQQEKTEQAAQDAGVSVRPMTQEEKDRLRSGEESRDELIERLAGEQEEKTPEQEQPEQTQNAQEAQPDPQAALREELNKCVAEVYVMEAEYTAWLEQANQSAIDEFGDLPEAEQTSSAKYNIGMKYLSEALNKEKECDAQMQDVETRIRNLLTQLGESTSLADEIHATYTEKKATLKAYYLGLH